MTATIEHDDERSRVRAALLDEPRPPKVRASRLRPLMLVASGVLVAAMLLVVLFNIDRGAPPEQSAIDTGSMIDIISPKPLSAEDVRGVARTDQPARDPSVELRRGGWVQVADKKGRLAQQYRCAELDPNPPGAGPGYLRMTQPDAEMYLAGGRILAFTGDQALVYAPSNRLESGDITGNVVIRLFESSAGRPANPMRDTPALVVTTSSANFNSVSGEVHCDSDVHVEMRSGQYDGHNLTLRINDRDGIVQDLTIEKTREVRIAGGSVQRSPEERAMAAAPSPPAQNPTITAPQPEAPPQTEISAAPATSPPSPPPAEAGRSLQIYRLTLKEDVQIRQGSPGAGVTITGDELAILFSMESKALPGAPAQAHGASSLDRSPLRTSAIPPLTLHHSLAVLAIAAPSAPRISIAPEPAEDDVIITCAGRLVMVPAADSASQLQSPSDALLEIRGAPVKVVDTARDATATCAVLRHHVEADVTELLGSSSWPMHMDSPQMRASGERFWWCDRAGSAGFTGPGWLHLAKPTVDRRSSLIEAAVFSTAFLAPSSAPSGPAGSGGTLGDPSLRISWTKSVDLEFADAGKQSEPGANEAEGKASDRSGQIKRAVFAGNVEVLSADLFVNADELAVGFKADPTGKRNADFITATGSVFAKSLGQVGTLRCGALEVGLKQDAFGETVPQTMKATGSVEAMDAEKTIWADSVQVRMRADGLEPDAGAGAGPSPDKRSDVEQFTADGNVQVVLANGGRVFADKMVGDQSRRQMQLTGKPVRVVYDQLVFERDTRVIVTEQETGKYHIDGPGKAVIYDRRMQPEIRSRIDPPVIDEDAVRRQIVAEWTESMTYDSAAGLGGGTLDLRGKVDAIATPSKLEANSIKGDAVTLEFEKPAASPDAAAGGADAPIEGEAAPVVAGGERTLRKLIAKGDEAELESRTWLNEDHAEKPRIFNVAGKYVEYDDRTGEALVVGDGRLVVRDEGPDGGEGAADPAVPRGKIAPFGRKGTSVFKWTQKLKMTRELKQIYDVVITGDVSAIHKSMDGSTATLTCQELQVTIERQPTTPEAAAADAPARPAVADNPFDLGGSAELRYLRAEGRVYIRTAKREVECDLFQYDYGTQTAAISTAPRGGGVVSILDRTTGATQQVDRAAWNMASDVITIERGAGTISR